MASACISLQIPEFQPSLKFQEDLLAQVDPLRSGLRFAISGLVSGQCLWWCQLGQRNYSCVPEDRNLAMPPAGIVRGVAQAIAQIAGPQAQDLKNALMTTMGSICN